MRMPWQVREICYLGKCLKSNGIWNLTASTDDGKAIIMNTLVFSLAKISPYDLTSTTQKGQKLPQFSQTEAYTST